jgi:hypothetical protein
LAAFLRNVSAKRPIEQEELLLANNPVLQYSLWTKMKLFAKFTLQNPKQGFGAIWTNAETSKMLQMLRRARINPNALPVFGDFMERRQALVVNPAFFHAVNRRSSNASDLPLIEEGDDLPLIEEGDDQHRMAQSPLNRSMEEGDDLPSQNSQAMSSENLSQQQAANGRLSQANLSHEDQQPSMQRIHSESSSEHGESQNLQASDRRYVPYTQQSSELQKLRDMRIQRFENQAQQQRMMPRVSSLMLDDNGEMPPLREQPINFQSILNAQLAAAANRLILSQPEEESSLLQP